MSAIAAAAIGGGIGAAGSLASAGMGMASSSAAAAANRKMMEDIWAGSYKDMQPYRRLGKEGAQRYREMLPELLRQSQYQEYTPEMYEQSPLYTPMVRNLAELQATPGYQFQLQQGQKELAQSAAARGGLLSGAQLQAAQGFGQRQAATGFQSAWERAQQAYLNAFNTNLAGQKTRMSGAAQQAGMLGDVTKIGYSAAQAPWALAQGIAPSTMQSNLSNAQAQGEGFAAGAGAIGNYAGGLYNAYKNQGYNTAPISSYDQLGTYGGKPIVA
jgi:hypothetical protein